jgi:hypothetical protein
VHANPSALDTRSLAACLRASAGEERDRQVDFLRYLDPFDARQAWREAGYDSLWKYCLGELAAPEPFDARARGGGGTDHVHADWLGGPPAIDNLRLRCRVHNALHAEETFGQGHMARFRRKDRPAPRSGDLLSPARAHPR